MNQITAIAMALLKGEVISIKTAFNQFGCTNAPREISRSIEKKFNVKVSKTPTKFKSKYGKSGIYFKYRLNRTPYNKEGIHKMLEYIQGQITAIPKTEAEQSITKQYQQIKLL